jgi:nicotinamidase-related amidase
MTNEKAFMIADRLFWIFIENTHPNKIDDYIEADPDNPDGTRNTERGRELFDEIEEFVRGIE